MEESDNFFPSRGVFLPSPAQQLSIHTLQTHHGLGLGCRLSPLQPYYLPCPKSLLMNCLCSAHDMGPGGSPLCLLPGQVDRVSFLSSQSGTNCHFCLDNQSTNAVTGTRKVGVHLRDDSGGSRSRIRDNLEPRLQRLEGVLCLR